MPARLQSKSAESGRAEDEQAQREHYCEMVDLWKAAEAEGRRHFPHEQLPRGNAIDPEPQRF